MSVPRPGEPRCSSPPELPRLHGRWGGVCATAAPRRRPRAGEGREKRRGRGASFPGRACRRAGLPCFAPLFPRCPRPASSPRPSAASAPSDGRERDGGSYLGIKKRQGGDGELGAGRRTGFACVGGGRSGRSRREEEEGTAPPLPPPPTSPCADTSARCVGMPPHLPLRSLRSGGSRKPV